jgi:hypothetical protein
VLLGRQVVVVGASAQRRGKAFGAQSQDRRATELVSALLGG